MITYCQKCFQKLPDNAKVCPECHYNNSTNLTQPNIIYGIHKSNIPQFIEADNEYKTESFITKLKKIIARSKDE